LFLGFVNKVTTNIVTTHVPSSKYLGKFYNNGEEYHGGLINSFVIIEGENLGFLGKVVSSELPEKERIDISSEALKEKDFHPLLKIEVLSMFDYFILDFEKSLCEFPNVGAKVYIARKQFIERYINQIEFKNNSLRTSKFAQLLNNYQANVDLSLQTIFSRHTAIVGTTGSGKSWTTSKLIENILNNNQKAILVDATGEYKNLAEAYEGKAKMVILGVDHHFSYKKLSIEDLFYLVKPSPNSQVPKLREAVKSLKLIENAQEELTIYIEEHPQGNKTLKKKNQPKELFLQLLNQNINEVSSDNLNFDIRSLAIQIENECFWENSQRNAALFGDTENSSLGFCATLITRINNLLNEIQFNRVFNFTGDNGTIDAYDLLDEFINHNTHNLFYIDLSELPFAFNIREVVANSIGKIMLSYAREGKFLSKPNVLIVDEAHQFLNKTVSNDFETFKLDAFDNISKEGRKYGLFLCITTQLPRDIPTGTLSQIGTFLIHRLINHRDKEIIMNAMPSANSEMINFLSELGQGEVILSSTDIKTPLLLKIMEPNVEPDSNTPLFN
ncbi:ATP-binding protein, partial [Bacillus sp. JJ1503]|uniref:ATP-binding protein n=1 Tax=Bacillus sp. JJ1503 TaxID=3122956 RepID=UPI002FFE05F1